MVEDGYDEIAQTYHEQRARFKSHELLSRFSSLLPPGGDVLDAGCGAGIPVARFLVNVGFSLTGIDVSSSMLRLARNHVPEAHFLKMDMRWLGFEDGRFDGICAFYSLFHVPREDHLQILIEFNRLLRQDGALIFSTGRSAWQGIEDFHGTRMFWSHPDRQVTRHWVIDAGFSVTISEVLELGGEEHYWVLARKTM